MYDRRTDPIWQLQDFLRRVEQAFDKKNLKDDSSKFAFMVTSLSPKADTEILPDSLDDDEK